MTTRILLTDDHKLFHEGVRTILEDQSDLVVVGTATDGAMAIELTKNLRPDIIIMDITMPKMNGIVATKIITREAPYAKVIALSMYVERHFIAKMLSAGARGYLRKDSAAEELIQAVRAVQNGFVFFGKNLIPKSPKNVFQLSEIADFFAANLLTPKEQQVLQMIAEGKSSKEIGALLDISAKTVDKHRAKIMEKLKIYNVAELTKYALREGLTPL